MLDYFAHFAVPIHPRVADALGLAWVTPSDTYNFHDRERLTFDDYYRRYIRLYG